MFLNEQEETVCGKVYWTFDPHNGKKISNIWTCKKFRECHECAANRVGEEVASLYRTMKEVNLYTTQMSDKGFRRFTRKVKAEHYRRYPVKDDLCIIVSDIPMPSFEWLEIDKGSIDRVARACLIPEGTRTSGSLLKEEEEEVYVGPEEVVHIPVFYENASIDDDACEAALQQAVNVFWQDRPCTAQDMIDTYHSCLDIVLQARGLPRPRNDRDMFVARTVKLNNVDWNGYNPILHGNAQVFDDAQTVQSYKELFGIRIGA